MPRSKVGGTRYKKKPYNHAEFLNKTKVAIDNMDEKELIACEMYFKEMLAHTNAAILIKSNKQ